MMYVLSPASLFRRKRQKNYTKLSSFAHNQGSFLPASSQLLLPSWLCPCPLFPLRPQQTSGGGAI